MTPTNRLRWLHCVRRYHRRAAELDEVDQLGSVGIALCRMVRAAALAAGCVAEDVAEVAMGGCVEGRGQ